MNDAVAKPAVWRDRLSYPPALLGTVALVAAWALSLTQAATRQPIAAAEARDLQATLAQVLPAGYADNDLAADAVELDGPQGAVRVHLARRGGRTVAALFQTGGRGYAGPITLLMAVDAAGRVLGVRVLKHSETPGLGDKIEVARHPWINGFAGRSLGDPAAAGWAVRKDGGVFDAFAGATVTPRAVVGAVRGGLEFVARHRRALFGDPA